MSFTNQGRQSPGRLALFSEDVMDVFKRYNYDRNGPSFNDVMLENPLETPVVGAIYQFTLNELRYFSDIPGLLPALQKKTMLDGWYTYTALIYIFNDIISSYSHCK